MKLNKICFTTVQIILLILFGVLFNILLFNIICSIVLNIFQIYTLTIHMKKQYKCIIFTQSVFIIFGVISKSIPIEWSFFIALLSMRYIYINAPLKLTQKGKSRQWHRNRIQLLMIIYIILSLILLYFKLNLIANCILWSLNMVALTLFDNVDE